MNFEKSKEKLEELAMMSPEKQKEFMKTDEFKKAKRKYGLFHPSQRGLYGKEVNLLLDGRTYN